MERNRAQEMEKHDVKRKEGNVEVEIESTGTKQKGRKYMVGRKRHRRLKNRK